VRTADPFGRETPRGTITGFNQAVHRKDIVGAARYMQVTAAQRRNVEELGRELAELIDRYYAAPVTSLSHEPEGAVNDGLPLDREHVVLTIAGNPVPIELVRVTDPQTGLIWLISSQTVAQVPALSRSPERTWLERVIPQRVVESTLFGVSLAQWVGLAATLVVPLSVLLLLSAVFLVVTRRSVTDATRRALLESGHARLRWPVILLITLGVHLVAMPSLGFSLTFRFAYSPFVLGVAVVIAAWALWRLLALSVQHARTMAQRRGQTNLRSLLFLAERVCKTFIVMVAIFAVLAIAGVDTTTALAGVGLGGVAVALGAQKSVENLLGGVFLLTDRALAVGDTCSISNRLGVVEDITMRSVRLRTIEQTLLSVPAGILSQSNVENFATRDKIPVQSTLRLQYGTTAGQLRRVLSDIRSLLIEHSDIETGTARIRLVDFGERAIDLELFAYVLTPDVPTFLAVREELLLTIATIVEASGTSFAQPTIVYKVPTADALSSTR